jgi:hypothetical protein
MIEERVMYGWMGKGVLKSCYMNPVELSMLNPGSVYNYSYDDAVLLYLLLLYVPTGSNEWQHNASCLYRDSSASSEQHLQD